MSKKPLYLRVAQDDGDTPSPPPEDDPRLSAAERRIDHMLRRLEECEELLGEAGGLINAGRRRAAHQLLSRLTRRLSRIQTAAAHLRYDADALTRTDDSTP
jgi:DNA repair ATPase RecN